MLVLLVPLLGWVYSAYAQGTIVVRLIDVKNGNPVKKAYVLVYGYSDYARGSPNYTFHASIRTDKNGKAEFRIPETAPVYLSLTASDWESHDSDTFRTADVQKSGVITPRAAFARATELNVSPLPGEIVFVFRRFTWWQRILQEIP
jgi:hypothetical protein